MVLQSSHLPPSKPLTKKSKPLKKEKLPLDKIPAVGRTTAWGRHSTYKAVARMVVPYLQLSRRPCRQLWFLLLSLLQSPRGQPVCSLKEFLVPIFEVDLLSPQERLTMSAVVIRLKKIKGCISAQPSWSTTEWLITLLYACTPSVPTCHGNG